MSHIVDVIRETYSKPKSANTPTDTGEYCVGGALMMSLDEGMESTFPNCNKLAEGISYFFYGNTNHDSRYINDARILIKYNDTYHYKRAWRKLEQILGEKGDIE